MYQMRPGEMHQIMHHSQQYEVVGAPDDRCSPERHVETLREDGFALLERQKHKHKLVEKSRRERTKDLTNELQSLVPALHQFEEGTSINMVLEGVLEYIREAAEKSEKLNIKHKPMDEPCYGDTRILSRNLKRMSVHQTIPRGVFAGAFDTAPMGMCMASMTGELVWYNQNFNSIFGVGLANQSQPPTMFSLTAPESLHATIQAASAMMSGTPFVTTTKKCVTATGNVANFQVEMRRLTREDKPKYFLCYVKPISGHNPCLSVCGAPMRPNLPQLEDFVRFTAECDPDEHVQKFLGHEISRCPSL